MCRGRSGSFVFVGSCLNSGDDASGCGLQLSPLERSIPNQEFRRLTDGRVPPLHSLARTLTMACPRVMTYPASL